MCKMAMKPGFIFCRALHMCLRCTLTSLSPWYGRRSLWRLLIEHEETNMTGTRGRQLPWQFPHRWRHLPATLYVEFPYMRICPAQQDWLTKLVTNMYILGNLYQYKFFLESHHSPKNALVVLAMGQICQRRASVGDAPRTSVPAEAPPCMPKKHDPKRYANDYSRPKLLGWENKWLFKMPRRDGISWRDLTCSHVMFFPAPTPRTIMNV